MKVTRQKAALVLVYHDAAAEFIYQAALDKFSFAGDDGNTGIGFDPFHYIIDRFRGVSRVEAIYFLDQQRNSCTAFVLKGNG